MRTMSADDQARTIRTDKGSDIGATMAGRAVRTKRTIKTGCKFVAVRLEELTRTAAPDSRLVTAIAEKAQSPCQAFRRPSPLGEFEKSHAR